MHAIETAIAALRHSARRPVRIWLTRDDMGELLRLAGRRDAVRVKRYRGIPVSICLHPARSRVVGHDGVVEYV